MTGLKIKNFNTSFEDIFRIQTAWKVPDPQLREELRIFVSQKVIPAYRNIVSWMSGRDGVKYIKYSPEDIENSILDLFQGTPLILHQKVHRNTSSPPINYA